MVAMLMTMTSRALLLGTQDSGDDGQASLPFRLPQREKMKCASVDLDNQLTLVLAGIIDGCNVDDNGIKYDDDEFMFLDI